MSQTVSSTEFGIAGAWLAEYTLQTLDAGVLFFDSGGQIVQWNSTAARLLGVTEEQLAGRRIDDPWWAATNADGHQLSESDNPIQRTLETGEQVNGGIIAIRCPDGSEMWLSITALPVFGPDRQVRGALASIVSIAGGKRVTEILASAVHCGRAAFEHSMTAHVLVDRSGRICDWNRSLCQLIDRADVELVGQSFDMICDLDLESVWTNEMSDLRFETHALSRDGKRLPVTGRFTVVEWPGTGRAVMLQLIDGRMFQPQSNSDVRSAETASYSQIKVAMLTTTVDGVVVECNESTTELFGRAGSEILGHSIDDHVTLLPTDVHQRHFAEATKSSTPLSFGPCSVSSGRGPSVLKELFVCCVEEGSPLLLVQLVDVPLESLVGIADRFSTPNVRPDDII